MTTSILDVEDLLKTINGEKAISPAPMSGIGSEAPVSVQELFNRAKEIFTPEEAEALARRIEEGREQAYD
jgi:hypothetical protein